MRRNPVSLTSVGGLPRCREESRSEARRECFSGTFTRGCQYRFWQTHSRHLHNAYRTARPHGMTCGFLSPMALRSLRGLPPLIYRSRCAPGPKADGRDISHANLSWRIRSAANVARALWAVAEPRCAYPYAPSGVIHPRRDWCRRTAPAGYKKIKGEQGVSTTGRLRENLDYRLRVSDVCSCTLGSASRPRRASTPRRA